MSARYGTAIRAGGGAVDQANLPDLGIRGNFRVMMQDRNSAQTAEVIQKWLVGKGLAK